ncbi:MAG TPA: TonB family protein [Gemmatimonadaceae bacterium]|nr:TonB family protein [Gemmatimonadaceae bacterium]
MFNNLIESKRKKDRSAGGTAMSVIVHAVLILLVVVVTANAGQKMVEEHHQEDLKFVKVKPKAPPPPEKPPPPPPKNAVVTPPPPKGFQVVTAPIKIPDKIPPIDLSKPVTNAADFSGIGQEGGRANGVAGGKAVNTNKTYFAFQVEKQTMAKPGNPKPRYPEMLESAHVQGQVLVEFVVDTLGHVDMSQFKVIKSTNELFTDAVKRVLPQWKFYPAETGGHKVKQLVQMPLTFTSSQ